MHRVFFLALLGLLMTPLQAADAPLTLAEAERLALTNEPGVQAAMARAEANRERAISAGELPDPQIRAGLANLPTDTFDFDQEPMTQAQLGVRQMFPAGGSREAASRRFRAQARGQEASAEARRRAVRLQVREAWLDVRFQEASLATLREDRSLFADLVEVTRALYAEGRQNQQDLLRAQLELSRLDDRMLDIGERIRVARAELARWLGRERVTRPLATGWPAWDEVPAEAVLADRLAGHPRLGAMREQIDAAEAGIEHARARYNPAWAVDASYGYRDGRDAMGGPRADFFSLMVSLEVPLFTGDRQDRDIAAAVRDRVAEEARWRDELRSMRRELGAALARWEQLGKRLALYDRDVIPQAGDQVEAALLAYQNDTGDFADVMRGHITLLDAHLERLRLKTERFITWARLDYLGDIDDA